MREMMESAWYNPSAAYGEAVRVEKIIAGARAAVAGALGVDGAEIVFTGGGTEADSLALLGAAARLRGPGRVLLFAGEHPAVLETAAQLAAMGHRVETVPATEAGVLDLAVLSRMLEEGADLVSCMQVNNETGAVQPIAEIAKRTKEKNPQALLHVDGAQGFLRLPLNVRGEGVDLYTVSSHKVHGPKGVGALYVRKGVKLLPQLLGGGQEAGLRSGTENTAGIAGFGAAVAWMLEQAGGVARLRGLKLRLYEQLRNNIEGLRVNGPGPETEEAAPHILSVSFPGVGGEVMLHALEAEGVLVGTGAACSSKKRGMSAAFQAMAAPKWAADSAVRFSFGLFNTEEDVDNAAEAVVRCYGRYKAFQRR